MHTQHEFKKKNYVVSAYLFCGFKTFSILHQFTQDYISELCTVVGP